MNDFLSQSHAETLLSDCTSLITKDKSLNPKKLSIEFENFTTKEDDEFKLSVEGNDVFNELINHNAKKVKKSLNSLFDLDVSFEKILLKRFASEKQRLPYQSYFDKDSNTVVAILTVGALRTLSLKTSAGKKIAKCHVWYDSKQIRLLHSEVSIHIQRLNLLDIHWICRNRRK